MSKRRHPSVAPGDNVPLRLESCPNEGPIRVRFLGDIRGALIHKPKPKVQIPCPGVKDCKADVHRGKTQWRGYAPAEWWREGQYRDWCPCVFEVTEHLGEQLLGAELRGTIWRIERRIGDYGTREVHGTMIGEVDPSALRPTFSVIPTLVRVFDALEIALDVPPHKPARLLLTPSPGDPPPDLEASNAQEKIAGITERDKFKQMLAAGTLPEAIRRRLPRMIAALEAEIAAERR